MEAKGGAEGGMEGARVLFYATFRRAAAAAEVANDEAHSLWAPYRGRFTLAQLRRLGGSARGHGPAHARM